MQLCPTSSREQRGSTLMTALFLCLTIMTVLGSFLALISSRYKMTVRARNWNSALPLAEAGMEEALTHLQDDPNPTDNGWTSGTVGGLPVYLKQRNFTNGSYFSITLYNANSNNPIIYSTGFMPVPLSANNYISRTVKVTGTKASSTSTNAISFAAMQNIQMVGNGLAVDSFNSGDPTLSTSGQYDSTKASQKGNIGCVAGTVDLGNHSLAGSIYLNTAAESFVSAGQMTGTTYSNQRLSYPSVALPNTTWLVAPVNNSTQIHDFNLSGDYYVNDALGITVEAGVTVRVRLDTTTFNPANLTIVSSAGSSGALTIYQVSGSMSLSGNATVNTGRARNFYYYGLPGVTTITFSGASSFIGVIYAPEADFSLSGGGSGNGLVGSSVTKSISMHGHYNLHYDEDLTVSTSASASSSGFTVTAWQEL